MTLIRKMLHWMFEHPAHHHYYRYEAYMDDRGRCSFYWRCTFILCDAEIVDEEAIGADA